MKKGDYVDVPRFCKVKIEKVFRSRPNAAKQKFHEPTHYNNPEYEILGKHIGPNRMEFAAVMKRGT